MKKLAPLFLLWLLMLAIPVQGIAAATMLFCGAEHHHVAVAEQGGHAHHHHDVAKKTDATQSSDQHASGAMAKDKCSSCAACCIGAVMVTALSDPEILPPSSEKIDLVFSSHLGHISDGLERPPRA
ncbi:hypothetical protein [Undibacterium terreum]|uniref:DUF2946 domain-containing protein n=1 Tax=Undibacterium terreum TaxID=1224302 RepID=A0A916UA14_9BURK|nr:hypothetical protein [Undibacterium terreum]GGC63531.1 hypothetical protein GCM10011396_08130 [Undibacterium terreum]